MRVGVFVSSAAVATWWWSGGGGVMAVFNVAAVAVVQVMDAREVVLLVTGTSKSYALYKAIEEGVSHMWTCSMLQMHPNSMVVCDEEVSVCVVL
jgi:glucosamine-6-phosphate deaminase